VIRFLNVKNIYPAEIHHHLLGLYGEGVMNENEKYVPDGFRECPQMNTNGISERSGYRLFKWTGSQFL
jgi:hypothetical protein